MSNAWQESQADDGRTVLSDMAHPLCQLSEGNPLEIQGKLKNTMAIGAVTYEIYGWNDPANHRNVREYLAVDGFGDTETKIMFLLYIPLENAEVCIMDASQVLQTLSASED